jgi:hypothetical protein
LAIDIGAAAIDRSTYSSGNQTVVGKENTANAGGTINTVQIFANQNMSTCEAATFYVVSGNYLSTRDYETLGAVTAGSTQTFTGLSIDVLTGDYLGTHFPDGAIDYDLSGSGFWRALAQDYIPCTNQVFTSTPTRTISLYGTGTEGGGATEKFGADTGTGADAKVAGNPLAAINGSETGSGADSLPAREIALPEAGSGVDALVSLQTPAAKTASDTGSGVDACVSLQTPVAKTSSDAGSGVEAMPVSGAILAGSETGSGIEAFIARLLAAADTGYGAEASEIGGGGLLKHLFASELGEGADGLTAKIEMPTKGGGMKLWT